MVFCQLIVIYMLEPKARGDMEDGQMLAKKDAALRWCKLASNHASQHGGKLRNHNNLSI
jgi:type III restriction enzyme